MIKQLLTTLIGIAGYAQGQAQITIQPEAGISISNYRVKSEFYVLGTQAKASPLAGVSINVGLSGKAALETGIYYEQNGFKQTDFDVMQNTTIHSIEVPLSIIFTPETKSRNLSFGFGFYGTYHAKGTVEFNGVKSDLKFAYNTGGSQYYISKPADYGWRLSSMLNLTEKMYLKAHLQMSIQSLFYESDAPDAYFNVKNYNYGVSIGYKILAVKKTFRKPAERPELSMEK